MKYVCDRCGQMLRVDRDLDDDRAFERALLGHRYICPNEFIDDRLFAPAPEQRPAI